MLKVKLLCISIAVLLGTGMLAGSSHAEIDPDSVVGVWLLDEGKDNTTRDSSGNGHDGELKGNVNWVEGKFGKALEFPGIVGNYVDIPGDDRLDLVTWSVAVWLKIERVNGEVHAVIKSNPETQEITVLL